MSSDELYACLLEVKCKLHIELDMGKQNIVISKVTMDGLQRFYKYELSIEERDLLSSKNFTEFVSEGLKLISVKDTEYLSRVLSENIKYIA
jgi:hypothetical protein